jgi:putative tryptophan/tyrosine transport system substrate-binding protein
LNRYDTSACVSTTGAAMRRRELIIALGGAAVWPLAALGQQTASRIVGVLGFGSLEAAQTSFSPGQQRLAEMGYVEGRNLAIEYRWADSRVDRMTALANDLVQRHVNAIVVYSGPAVMAAKAATTSIPIIFFTGFDPVASGFVPSLNRPGGNVTGISVLNSQVLAKRLEVLCELVSTAKSVGYLYSPSDVVSGQDRIVNDIATAAEVLGVKLLIVKARRADDFEGAFATIASARSDALLLSAGALLLANREMLVGLAARHKIPAAYPIREFAADGGLVSYGPNYAEARRQVGDYLGRVLNGEKPGDLPVQQVTKLELVINMKTAKALGLTVPISLLGRADELIE